MPALRLALAGLGTVGAGVLKLLTENKAEIENRAGREIKVVSVSARSKGRDRGVDLSPYQWADDPQSFASQADIDVVVELIGGEAGPALSLVKSSLENGKSVVTANKALLAHHGVELAELAAAKGAGLMFEAAVAGGIPVIKLLRDGLAANKVTRLYGILNGTCNYILTTMADTGRSFDDVLKEAQALGYAEAEPSLDVDGWDTAHKLSLLTSLAYGVKPSMKDMGVSGIRAITAQDIVAADELGYRIKLLGQSENTPDGRVLQIVAPCLVPKKSSLAHVSGVLNAIYTEGNHVGSTFIEGRGAGAGPTASAVVADLIDLARGNKAQPFSVTAAKLSPLKQMDASDWVGEFYLRLVVLDRPGVIADIAAILRDFNISIESLLQRGRDPDQPVTVIITTHEIARKNMDEAASRMAQLKTVAAQPLILPLLKF
jgi:homoserine dehydrogenase